VARERGALKRGAAGKQSPPLPDPERLARASALSEKAPEPARIGGVLFGTAGWTDRTLIESGAFYPRGVSSPEARLRHYSAHFSMVEVDATYYTLLSPELAERWVSWTPPEFRFDVKAFPLLTGHPIDVTRLPADLKAACHAAGHERRVYPNALPREIYAEMSARFLAFVAPLARSARLGSVLIQFPPWFTATRANTQKLEALRHDYPELPFAAEFRDPSWLLPERRQSVLDTLRGLGMSYVCVDELDMPEVVAVTHADLAVVRFHGKNREGWEKKGASVHERFDYLYEPSELRAWVGPVQRLSREAAEVHAVFNNCVRNYAVLGAKDLAVLVQSGLDEGSPEEPVDADSERSS
jgi:uncharacterized protein YecE (DUF72 family)